ncbi:MAG: hypothetical protein ACYC0Q_05950 [Eubacteriales bacterium]
MDAKTYSLEINEPYADLLAKSRELSERIDQLEGEGQLAALRQSVLQAADQALETEAEAILDPGQAGESQKARKRASELAGKLEAAERTSQALRLAASKVSAELAEAREIAVELVVRQAKADHRGAVKALIDAMRAFGKAVEIERDVVSALGRAIGFNSYLFPVAQNLGNTVPGREDSQNSILHWLVRQLKIRGYEV